nr:sugar transporter stl1 [Quercus suber]
MVEIEHLSPWHQMVKWNAPPLPQIDLPGSRICASFRKKPSKARLARFGNPFEIPPYVEEETKVCSPEPKTWTPATHEHRNSKLPGRTTVVTLELGISPNPETLLISISICLLTFTSTASSIIACSWSIIPISLPDHNHVGHAQVLRPTRHETEHCHRHLGRIGLLAVSCVGFSGPARQRTLTLTAMHRFGYDQGVMGGLLTLESFVAVFPEIDTRNVSGNSPRAVNQDLGCFAGAVMCIWLGERLGRKRTIFFGSAIMIVGAAIQASSFSLGQLIAGRVITGLGNGFNTSTVPVWQSETSKSHKRGQMVMIEGALITGGIMLSYWIDYGMSIYPGSVSWRFPIAFQIVFAIIIFVTILGLPESPRWLILKGKDDEALQVMAALNDLPTDDEYIQSEFAAIKDTVLEAADVTFSELFTMGKDRNFHRAALGYVNQMFQQISGINLITYYAATIYQGSIGLSPDLSRLLAALNGTEYFLASWVAVFTVEKFGRRPLMLFGAVGMSVSMCFLAGLTSKKNDTGLGIGAAVFLFVFNSFFAIGWLGMTWLYPAEIVPLRIRAPSNALSTSANWIFNFMVVMITPIAFANIGFAVINAFIVPCVYFFYPETAYRSLEEMDEIFWKSTSVFDVVRLADPKVTPNRYDKHGNLLISYLDTEEHRRRSSVLQSGVATGSEKRQLDTLENRERASHNEAFKTEAGLGNASGTSSEKN